MIIVLGSDGMLGAYIYKYLQQKAYTIREINRENLDASQIEKIKAILELLISQDDWVINCMGVTNKRTDLDWTEIYMVNAIFPHLLDRICKRKNAHLIQPSTDCVFTDTSRHTNPDAEDSYGLSKSIGEMLIHAAVIRVSIIGEEKKRKTNLIEWVKSKNGQTIQGYKNHFWNGITCLEYAKLVEEIIRTNTRWNGIRTFRSQFKGNFCLTKYELIKAIVDAYKLDIVVTPVETETDNNKAMPGICVTRDLTEQLKELVQYTL
jgi:dTDP-4-dehydrorhamnose reductase